MVTCTRGWAEVKGTAKGRAREGEGERWMEIMGGV